MLHLPINHPLQPLYRTLAGLAGAYILAFGIIGIVETWGTPFFGRQPTWVLGLRTNLAFSVLSTVVGAIVVVGALIGRNVDRFINMIAGVVFLFAGLIMLALLHTDLNLLNFTVATCIMSFIFALVFGLAGLYGRVGDPREVRAEESFRHGGYDPIRHTWQGKPMPHRPEEPEEPERHRFA
jgi:hypothetical protein